MNNDNTSITKSYVPIKLGIDAPAKWYYVARQLDGATPQPVQKMDIDDLLHFVAKQQRPSGERLQTAAYFLRRGNTRAAAPTRERRAPEGSGTLPAAEPINLPVTPVSQENISRKFTG